MEIEIVCPKCKKHNVIKTAKWLISEDTDMETVCSRCKAIIYMELKARKIDAEAEKRVMKQEMSY